MVRAGKMASEKTQALYVPTEDSYEDKSLKNKENKYCTKFVLLWLLASLLIALVVGLCVQFLFPVVGRHYREEDSVDTLHVNLFETPGRSSIETQTKESDTDEPSLPWHLDFLINPTRLCDSWDNPESIAYQNNPEVKLLILVPSATGHFAHRMGIRKTWGAVAVKPHGPVRLGFMLGTTPNSTEQTLIRTESEIFGDLIQADFEDTFRNLTAKSVLMLKWVGTHCPHAQYFLKTDDDTFVNLPVLSRILEKPQYDPAGKFVGGYVHKGASPTRVPTEKYFVSEAAYPEEEFPPYASGSAYVTTGPVAGQLFDAARRVTPVLPMEDVFVTGLCADEIDADLLHDDRFQYLRPEEEGCSWDSFSSLATTHRLAPPEMDLVWQQMTKAIKEALNSGSSSSSFDSFGSLSMSDLFDWPVDNMFDYYYTGKDKSSDSNSLKTPDSMSIFDIFNRLRNQINSQLNGDVKGDSEVNDNVKQVESRVIFLAGDPGIDEPLALPSGQINKGNLLNRDAVNNVNDTADFQDMEMSVSSLLSRFIK